MYIQIQQRHARPVAANTAAMIRAAVVCRDARRHSSSRRYALFSLQRRRRSVSGLLACRSLPMRARTTAYGSPSIQLDGDLRTSSFYIVYELTFRTIDSYEHAMLIGAASDEAPTCFFFFRIKPAVMTARLVTIGRTPGKVWRVRSLYLSLHRLPLLLRGVPLALSAKRRSAPSAIMHSTSTPTTSTPSRPTRQDGEAGMAGAKIMLPIVCVHEYTDFVATNVYTDTYTEPLKAGRRLHRHLHGAPQGRAPSTSTPTRSPSKQGAVYTNTYTEPLEAGRRLH
jgi:hypothetical protein